MLDSQKSTQMEVDPAISKDPQKTTQTENELMESEVIVTVDSQNVGSQNVGSQNVGSQNNRLQRPPQNGNEPMDSQPIVSVYASNVEELVTQSTDESNPLNIMRSPIRYSHLIVAIFFY